MGADGIPLPEWVPADDVVGPRHDRQMLVVGATPTGFVLTRLLRAAGYDPVVTAGDGSPSRSRITYLPPAAVKVLAALGVGERVVDRGREVTRATVRWAGEHGGERHGTSAGSDSDGARAPSVVIGTVALCRLLRDGIDDVDDRGLDAVSPDGDGIAVTFDDGVREWFDLVIDAGGMVDAGHPADRTAGRRSLIQYEAVRAADAFGGVIEETWGPTAAVQRLPGAAADERLLRVTTHDAEPSAGGARRPPALESVDPDDRTRIRVDHPRLPEGPLPDRWWGTDRIARCGPAACPAAPAAGTGTALGFADALGLVWAIAREEVAVPEAVGTYAATRAGRCTARRRAVTGPDRSTPVPASSPLGSLYTLRAMALEPFFGTAPAALRVGDGA